MLRVRRTGRDLRQSTRGHERTLSMLRVVHRMNPVVGRAGMIGVPHEDRFRDRRSLQVGRNVAHAFALAQQRQCVEELRFVVFGYARVNCCMAVAYRASRSGLLPAPL